MVSPIATLNIRCFSLKFSDCANKEERINYSAFWRYYCDVINSVRDKFPQSAGNRAPSSSAPSHVSPLFPVLSGVYRPVCPWTWATRTTPAWLDNPGPSSTPEIEQLPVASSGQQPPPVNLSFPAVPRILLLILKQYRKCIQNQFEIFLRLIVKICRVNKFSLICLISVRMEIIFLYTEKLNRYNPISCCW